MSAVIYHSKAIETSGLTEFFFLSFFLHGMWVLGLFRWLSRKESTCQCQRNGLNPCVGKIAWRGKWQPTPVFLSGKSHGQRSLVGCSPCDRKRVGHDLLTKQQQQHCIQDLKHIRLKVLDVLAFLKIFKTKC